MAKKGKGPNKSTAIRDLVDANRDVSPAMISETLKAKGIDVSPLYASSIKSSYLRKMGVGKRKKRGKAGRPAKSKAAAATMSFGLSIETLVSAKRLADKMGGVDKAKEALDALARLQ